MENKVDPVEKKPDPAGATKDDATLNIKISDGVS